MKLYLLCLFVLALLVGGCGGGGNIIGLPLRQVQPGDSFTYFFQDTVNYPGYPPLSGEEEWVFVSHPSGMLENTYGETVFDFLLYDGDGTLREFGETGTEHLNFAPLMQAGQQVVLPVDPAWGTPLEGPVTITVPAGTFTAYTWEYHHNWAEYDKVWFAPSLGMMVKIVEYWSNGNVRTMVLSSHNLGG